MHFLTLFEIKPEYMIYMGQKSMIFFNANATNIVTFESINQTITMNEQTDTDL